MTVNENGSLIQSGNLLYTPKNAIRSLANIEEEPLQMIVITIN